MSPTPKPGILDIAPYVPGRASAPGVAKPLKLSANENPFGCSDAARQAYLRAVNEIHLYPDANTSLLRAAVAEHFKLEPERLVFGAGSDEVFAMATQAYLREGDNVVQPQFGFAAWAIAARAAGGEVNVAPERDYVVDVDAMLAAVDDRTRVMFLANPANPTGTWLPFSEIARLHARLPPHILLVLDGAYAECAGDVAGFSDGLDWVRDKNNVLVTRTFSKAYGLAALRVGWGYGPAPVIAAFDRIRLPFSVTRAGEAAAAAALSDQGFVARSAEHFAVERVRLAEALRALGLKTLPSATNFVTALFDRAPVPAQATYEMLAREGILVRWLKNYGMENALRISIGRSEETTRVIDAMTRALAQ
ncbi:MAG: histidinol-phosphate transaminase [Hyphomonadaceae bacterium]|nr:histidinol-phosphate transaminase [Hyphomonadaceae bacterium]